MQFFIPTGCLSLPSVFLRVLAMHAWRFSLLKFFLSFSIEFSFPHCSFSCIHDFVFIYLLIFYLRNFPVLCHTMPIQTNTRDFREKVFEKKRRREKKYKFRLTFSCSFPWNFQIELSLRYLLVKILTIIWNPIYIISSSALPHRYIHYTYIVFIQFKCRLRLCIPYVLIFSSVSRILSLSRVVWNSTIHLFSCFVRCIYGSAIYSVVYRIIVEA